jgi:hypothetical protein
VKGKKVWGSNRKEKTREIKGWCFLKRRKLQIVKLIARTRGENKNFLEKNLQRRKNLSKGQKFAGKKKLPHGQK